jgi:hypothetical protein
MFFRIELAITIWLGGQNPCLDPRRSVREQRTFLRNLQAGSEEC